MQWTLQLFIKQRVEQTVETIKWQNDQSYWRHWMPLLIKWRVDRKAEHLKCLKSQRCKNATHCCVWPLLFAAQAAGSAQTAAAAAALASRQESESYLNENEKAWAKLCRTRSLFANLIIGSDISIKSLKRKT